jgi:hypothetical protein
VDDVIVHEYTLEQAIEDGILVDLFGDGFKFDGKPVVVTAHLFNQVKRTDLLFTWDDFLQWRRNIMPTLPEEDRMFVTEINGKKVWVDETPSQFTMMYPEDY